MASKALERYFSLEGRTAVVTGGTRGIGADMAVALAEAGADIILIQVTVSKASEIVNTDTYSATRATALRNRQSKA